MSTIILTPQKVAKSFGERCQQRRLEQNFTRKTLAERAGVSMHTLKRFETTGQVSLQTLLALAHALGRLADFENVLDEPEVQSLEDFTAKAGQPKRKRGRQ